MAVKINGIFKMQCTIVTQVSYLLPRRYTVAELRYFENQHSKQVPYFETLWNIISCV